MNQLIFYKLQASGNDFILLDCRRSNKKLDYAKIARDLCRRKFSVGADGILVIEPSKNADFKMLIFNTDGSQAQMCGNGARCAALYYCLTAKKKSAKPIKFETKAGIIEAIADGQNIKIKLTVPFDYRPDFPIEINQRRLRVNFINTGVPHVVVFVQGLSQIDVASIGRQIRYHSYFAPAGTNVDFVEVGQENTICVRTYERGVEDETLSCGTGSAAAAIITYLCNQDNFIAFNAEINVQVQSGETLKVYLQGKNKIISQVWLEGKAWLIYRGGIYV